MKFTSCSSHLSQITLVVLLTSVLLGISGCGQKGPLRLPAEPPVQNQPQTQPAPQPTEPETPSNNTNNAIKIRTDISNFKDFDSAQDAIDYESMIGRVIDAVQTAAVPVIASLHGIVAGGGAAIAAAADIRLATPDTRFGMPIARTLGNCLSVANLNRLVHLLGESRTRYLLLTAEFLDLQPLLDSGFVSEVLDDPEACDERARALALHLTTLAPLTVSATREGLSRLSDRPIPEDVDLIQRCYLSDDFAEGIDAFFAKRTANWTGR